MTLIHLNLKAVSSNAQFLFSNYKVGYCSYVLKILNLFRNTSLLSGEQRLTAFNDIFV